MPITVNIATTAAQDAKLAALLAAVNAGRVAHNQTPYVDANDWCTQVLSDQLKSWNQQQDQIDAASVQAAYLAANNATQARVKTDLGL